MKTDELISRLAERPAPVSPLPRPGLRLGAWLAAAAAAVAAGAAWTGCRPDLAAALRRPEFWLHGAAGLAVAAFAGLGALASAVPGAERSRAARRLPEYACAGWLALIGADLARAASASGADGGPFAWHCVYHAAFLAAVPAALLLLMIRRAAPVRPALSAGLAALAAASAGNAGTRFLCSNETPLHTLVSHALPVLAAAALGAAAGRRALRW